MRVWCDVCLSHTSLLFHSTLHRVQSSDRVCLLYRVSVVVYITTAIFYIESAKVIESESSVLYREKNVLERKEGPRLRRGEVAFSSCELRVFRFLIYYIFYKAAARSALPLCISGLYWIPYSLARCQALLTPYIEKRMVQASSHRLSLCAIFALL